MILSQTYNPTFQKILLCGRFAKDPEMNFLPNGKAVCNFGLVINDNYGKGDYIPCVAWENKAKVIVDHCKKGTLVLVEGTLKSKSIKNSEGTDFQLVFQVNKNGVLNFMGNKQEINSEDKQNDK